MSLYYKRLYADVAVDLAEKFQAIAKQKGLTQKAAFEASILEFCDKHKKSVVKK